MKADRIPWRRIAQVSAVAGGSLSVASVAASLGIAWYFARVLLTPEREKPDNTVVIAVGTDTITLRLDVETRVPGLYGLWLDDGRTHVRVGQILETDEKARRVVRELLAVDVGTPAPGPGRWTSHIYIGSPAESLGIPSRDVVVDGELGALPAWVVDADGGAGGNRWAVLVHGRGAMREECLRAVPVLHELGLTCLVPSYRNDSLAPASPDGLIALGLTEWRDVDACIRYCLEQGADDVLLVGWSMGGAIVMQGLNRSDYRDRIVGAILDGPVIDWVEVLEHQARMRRLPRAFGGLVKALIGDKWASRLLVGAEQPLDLATTRWQVRADELDRPILLIHSRDDDVVPVGASEQLGDLRPDVVRFEPWELARHVKEWNTDPDRWNRVVAEFVRALPAPRPSLHRAALRS
ncbi:MAG: alpha/beta fold hydrolase [Mobilicoccus sp.]|nr:alpha/beta fold hydrolase [Mobilicoccus sp.]